MIIISHYQLENISFQGKTYTTLISPDLGLSEIIVTVTENELILPCGTRINKKKIFEMLSEKNTCFKLDGDSIKPVRYFSERSNCSYSLMPTRKAPTMLVSGIPMHRIKGTNPWIDTQAKINAFKCRTGLLLDTNTGLGYTAIQAAKFASHVISIEIEPVVISLCKNNPWSKELFTSEKISPMLGDSFEIVAGFPDNTFDFILHDPPTFALAGNLYSSEFYCQLFRVLKHSGELFHYIGDPASKTGSRTTGGVIKRLTTIGFKKILSKPNAFGIHCTKA